MKGWNNRFASLVGEDHPGVFKLIEVLQLECERVSTVILQDERGIRPRVRQRRVYRDLQTRLRNLCEDRANGRKTIVETLRGVSHNVRFGRLN